MSCVTVEEVICWLRSFFILLHIGRLKFKNHMIIFSLNLHVEVCYTIFSISIFVFLSNLLSARSIPSHQRTCDPDLKELNELRSTLSDVVRPSSRDIKSRDHGARDIQSGQSKDISFRTCRTTGSPVSLVSRCRLITY